MYGGIRLETSGAIPEEVKQQIRDILKDHINISPEKDKELLKHLLSQFDVAATKNGEN